MKYQEARDLVRTEVISKLQDKQYSSYYYKMFDVLSRQDVVDLAVKHDMDKQLIENLKYNE